MNYWMDLVWIGNTLYPRWFVFGILGAIILSPFAVVALFRLIGRG